MEYRNLGKSGLKVSVLSFGTAIFGGGSEFFKAWGSTDGNEAKRLIDLCLEAGLTFFDTTNVYPEGASEELLGEALKSKRGRVFVSTKATFPMGEGLNDYGSSRIHLTDQPHASLKRLQTDHIDIFHLHGMDAHIPVEETLQTLDDFVRAGKVRYLACSNFSSWHLMKSLTASKREGLSRYVGHQVYYSLVGRELEHQLTPLALDQ